MILITGASSGIGAACARKLASEGKELVLFARRIEKLNEIKNNLSNHFKSSISIFQLDIRDKKKVASWASEHKSLLEKATGLINNAGLARGLDPIQEGNPEDWDEMIDTNIKGLLYLTREVVPYFIRSQGGHIVNIGSVAGRWAYPKGHVYCATKAAVGSLTESMRWDLHGTNVRVTNIEPGMVKTDFSIVRLKDEKKADAVYQGVNFLTPEDVAEAVSWCLNRPPHVNIQEMVLFPTDQASTTLLKRR